MEVKTVIDILLKIKNEFPDLTKEEVLKVMELKVMMEANARNG